MVDSANSAIFLKLGRAVGSNSKHEFINSATLDLTELGTVGTNLPADTVQNFKKKKEIENKKGLKIDFF